MTTPTLKIGVAGLGGGARQMIDSMVKIEDVEIAAAADRDAGVLQKFAQGFGKPTYTEVEAMCEQADIDAVYIATPNRFHTAHAMMALENGKHVLLEKPMALTLDQADPMIEAAESRGLTLAVSAPHSFEPPIAKITEIIESGELGALWAIQTMHYGDWLYRPRTPEELNPAPEYGGGVLFRQAPHQIDMVRAMGGGLIKSLRASVTAWDPKRPVPGSYIAALQFEGGAFATASYSGYDRFHTAPWAFELREEEVFSEYAAQRKAVIALENPEAEAALKRAGGFGGAAPGAAPEAKLPPAFPWISSGVWFISLEKGDIRLTPRGIAVYGEMERRYLEFDVNDLGRDEVVRRFRHSVTTGEPPEHDGRWGKATEEVLLAMQESARTGREITLKHQVRPGPARR